MGTPYRPGLPPGIFVFRSAEKRRTCILLPPMEPVDISLMFASAHASRRQRFLPLTFRLRLLGLTASSFRFGRLLGLILCLKLGKFRFKLCDAFTVKSSVHDIAD